MPTGVPALGIELISTSGLTGDAQGNIYFADSRYVIRRIRNDGTIDTVAGNGISSIAGDGGPATAASLGGPAKLTSDGAGTLYFLDYARIRQVDSSGNIITVVGPGSTARSAPTVRRSWRRLILPATSRRRATVPSISARRTTIVSASSRRMDRCVLFADFD
jgi:hypothetical protein